MEYESILDPKSQIHKLNLIYLKIICAFLDGIYSTEIEKIKTIQTDYLSANDVRHYIILNLMEAENHLVNSRFKLALKVLTSEDFIAKCEHSIIFLAEREYLLGEITRTGKLVGLTNSLEYYERAFEILKDASITELTWKVLLRISEIYLERGNIQKAKKPFTYSFELFEFISDNIKNPELKSVYLQDRRHKVAVEKFKVMRETIYS